MTNKQAAAFIGHTAARLGRQVEQALAKVDLSSAQYRMLFQLVDGAEASTTLARKLEVSAPSVTAVVDGLANRGLIERTHSSEDRRKVSLDLTDEGRKVLTLADESVEAHLRMIAGHLEGTNADELLDDLLVWSEALDAYRAARMARRARKEVGKV